MRPGFARDLVVLAAGWLALALLVDPRGDVPLIDDWIYASSVERLVAGEGLHFIAYMAAIPLVQIVWGTLFAIPGGFSHTALRLSTTVLAAGGIVAYACLLRALGIDRWRALLGAAALALYPVWFVLSFTFMTDVPCVALIIMSLCALAVGLREERPVSVGLGLALATGAFMIRPIAIAVPIAVLVSALRVSRQARPWVAAGALLTLTAMAATAFVVGQAWPVAGGEGGLGNRVGRLRYVFSVSPLVYLEALCSMVAHLGIAALPVVVVTAPPLRRWPWRLAAVLLIGAAIASTAAPLAVSALRPWATWSLQELGASHPLLQTPLAPTAWRSAAEIVLTGVGMLAAACLLARLARAVREGALADPRWLLVSAFGGISIAICFVLWFFYDRYFLPLVPVAIALVLRRPADEATREASTARDRRASMAGDPRMRAAALVLVVLALLDVTGTRDMLAYARTVGAAVDRLRARGVAEHDIDAGYVQNGWRLYAHPENLRPGADVDRDVPNVTSADRLPFLVANGPVAGYVVEESFPVAVWWAQGDGVVLLRRSGGVDEDE